MTSKVSFDTAGGSGSDAVDISVTYRDIAVPVRGGLYLCGLVRG